MKVRTVKYGSPGAAREFTQSFLETGFAVLTDHPIPLDLIRQTYAEWEGFFASASKHDHKFEQGKQAGYFPFRSENAKDVAQKDLKEFYHYYPMRKELPESTRRFTPELYRRMEDLGRELLQWVEEETPPEVAQHYPIRLSQMVEGGEETLLRILHYPPLTGAEEEGAVRAAAHEDINLITLLPAATAPGLEVKDKAGNWISVACDPGMIIINSGDMLRETSRGYFPSTTHRVVNPRGAEAKLPRFSMPLFLHPRTEVHLTETLTAGQYLKQRLREIGLL
jgi:isopenicillin N synthase-like dioxygenase